MRYGRLRSLYLRLVSPNRVARLVGVNFGRNCSFGSRNFGTEPSLIRIGDNFRTSINVSFVTHDGAVHVVRNLYDEYKNMDIILPIIIGNNVYVGCNCVLLPGSRIGDNVVIGAGSVVRGDLESNSVYAGTPVRYICTIDEYVEKNRAKFIETKHLGSAEKKIALRDYSQVNWPEL